MKTATIYLSSVQLVGTPLVVDGYLLVDPTYGYNYTYPFTADASFFTSTTGASAYPNTDDGGLIFPSGFLIQTTITSLTAGPYKGPYTITYCASGLDTTYYNILKIIYDFGDGSPTTTINRAVLPGYGPAAPQLVNINHNYWPESQGITTYTPTITVINGNLSFNIFYVTFSIYPGSLYDFGDYNLLNSLQLTNGYSESIEIVEITNPNYVSLFKYVSASGGTTSVATTSSYTYSASNFFNVTPNPFTLQSGDSIIAGDIFINITYGGAPYTTFDPFLTIA